MQYSDICCFIVTTVRDLHGESTAGTVREEQGALRTRITMYPSTESGDHCSNDWVCINLELFARALVRHYFLLTPNRLNTRVDDSDLSLLFNICTTYDDRIHELLEDLM